MRSQECNRNDPRMRAPQEGVKSMIFVSNGTAELIAIECHSTSSPHRDSQCRVYIPFDLRIREPERPSPEPFLSRPLQTPALHLTTVFPVFVSLPL